MTLQDVTIIEDDSVKRAIHKTALKLGSKYSKKRKINEKFLVEFAGAKKFFVVLLNVFLVLIICISSMLLVSSIVSRASGTIPTFAGFSLLRVSSESMQASGFDVGDNIVVKSVDTNTLRVGDNIAFYVYPESYKSFYDQSVTKLSLDKKDAEYKLTLANFFGFQSKEIVQASKAKSMLVFHQIVNIYEDENGNRWFETKGTSNTGIDNWKINEDYVVGIYDSSAFARFLAYILTSLTSNFNFILLILIPFLIFTILLVISLLKDIQRAKLELDVVEEKRKLTDEICVKYGIGYSMDTKTKYKVLAQASDEDKKLYLSLLWKDGSAPNSIKKYIIRKQLYLSGMEELLNLNRTCETMFKNGEKPSNIAKFYIEKKKEILKEQKQKEKELKQIKRNY